MQYIHQNRSRGEGERWREMSLFASSPSNSKFTIFSPPQNPNSSKFYFTIPFKISHETISHPSLACSHESSSSSSPPLLQEKPQNSATESEMEEKDKLAEEIMITKKSLEELLVVRRPVMEFSEEDDETEPDGDGGSTNEKKQLDSSSMIDAELSKLAKKMPIFEPERMDSKSEDKPLMVNLDLALYKAKILTRNYRYEEAEIILQKVNLCQLY